MLHPRPQLRLNLALGTCLISQVVAGPLACILPRDTATGVELRWRLPEGNRADAGDPAADSAADSSTDSPPEDRLRTCSGARVARVHARLVDRADRMRDREFDYPCDAGDDPPAERLTEPAEIFVDLRPGRYDLDLRWQDATGRELGQRQEIVQVEPDTLLPLDLQLTSPLVPFTLDLRGSAACTQLALEIFYADPEQDLHDPAEPRYRSALVSDTGLTLATPDAPLACAAIADGPQVFPDLDRGAYRLRLTVDGRRCELDFVVDEPATPLPVDLAKPGCAG